VYRNIDAQSNPWGLQLDVPWKQPVRLMEQATNESLLYHLSINSTAVLLHLQKNKFQNDLFHQYL
jgi:hypothetical protein